MYDLSDFFELLFRPVKRVTNNVARFRRGIRDLEQMLGHRPTIADLNLATLERFRDLTDVQAFSAITRLWRFAAQLELTKARPKQLVVRPRVPRVTIGEPGTLRHFFETVYRPQRVPLMAAKGLRHHRKLFVYLAEHFGHDIELAEQNDAMAADFFARQLKRVHPTTVAKYRQEWFAIWRYAHSRGAVACLPTVPPPPSFHNEPDAWTEEEARRLIETAARLEMPSGSFPYGVTAGKFFKAMFLVAWWTALRRTSLFSIRRADVDLQSGWLTVPAKNMKTKRGKKLRLGIDALEAVRAIWLPERELLFPPPAGKPVVGIHFKRILREAGIAPSQHHAGLFHKWRRTTATAIAGRSGVEAASAILGHAESEVTKRYVDPSRLQGSDATQILPALLESVPGH